MTIYVKLAMWTIPTRRQMFTAVITQLRVRLLETNAHALLSPVLCLVLRTI